MVVTAKNTFFLQSKIVFSFRKSKAGVSKDRYWPLFCMFSEIISSFFWRKKEVMTELIFNEKNNTLPLSESLDPFWISRMNACT